MFGQNVQRPLALHFPPWQWFSLELVLHPECAQTQRNPFVYLRAPKKDS